MKSYIENFKKYRFLLWELVKKGVKIQKIIFRYFMDTVRTVNDNDRTKCSIWYIVWKQGSTFPSIYLMWTFDV